MKRVLLLILGVLLILGGVFMFVQFVIRAPKGKGALQVTANVKSKVLLNGKEIGTTPLCKCKDQEDTIQEGDYLLVVQPEDPNFDSFTTKITIRKEVLTAVDRTFLPGSLASAYILTLESIDSQEAELQVVSIPEGAVVTVDGNPEGITPFRSKKISPSEHEVELQKRGFNKKTIRIRTVESYKLIATVLLGTESVAPQEPTPTPLAASPSASLTTTPAPTTANPQTVTIGNTPTGFLRVREGPGTAYNEVTRVQPNETYPLLDEQSGWYKIRVGANEGWISGTYATKN